MVARLGTASLRGIARPLRLAGRRRRITSQHRPIAAAVDRRRTTSQRRPITAEVVDRRRTTSQRRLITAEVVDRRRTTGVEEAVLLRPMVVEAAGHRRDMVRLGVTPDTAKNSP